MANILATPRFFKNKALLIKTEASYGTDSAPAGATNWIEARDINFQPYDAQTVERNLVMPYMGSGGQVVTSKWAKVTFDVLLAGSGTLGTAPKWAPLMLACGTAETVVAATSVAYNLVSTGFSSVTIWVNVDGTYHKLVGARGTVSFKLSAQGVPMMSFAFDCCYVAPVAAAMPAVTRTGWQMDEGANSVNTTALTFNGVGLALSEFNFDLGNQIARIDLPGPQVEVAITDRAPSASLTVLAPAIGTFDPFALADAGTNATLTLTHGSAAGRKVKIDAKTIVSGAEYAEVDGVLAYRLSLSPTPDTGNDELAVTCL